MQGILEGRQHIINNLLSWDTWKHMPGTAINTGEELQRQCRACETATLFESMVLWAEQMTQLRGGSYTILMMIGLALKSSNYFTANIRDKEEGKLSSSALLLHSTVLQDFQRGLCIWHNGFSKQLHSSSDSDLHRPRPFLKLQLALPWKEKKKKCNVDHRSEGNSCIRPVLQ